ncbi:MAG: PKD domain-containing protein [Anaerolineae bacterium]|nr:PKD domain-containing protein [Anaerolineae bacterium]
MAELSRLSEKATGCGGDTVSEVASTSTGESETVPSVDFTAPSSFDWRSYQGSDWMTPVKDQAQCGSCWSFAAVGAAEAAINIASSDAGLDRDLSEQYMVSDCSPSGTCCGGSKSGALVYIRDSGIPDETCMPYADGSSGYDGSTCSCPSTCGSGCTYNTGGNCSDKACSDRCGDWESRLQYINSTGRVSSDPQTMKQALVDIGPLAVSMGMGPSYGGYFDGDIYRCTTDEGTNHAVVIVGYDDAGGYWWVRNSWGSGWNGDGYFQLGYGECSVEEYPYYADASVVPALMYVDTDATGAVTGLSWTDAYTNVQDALDIANAWGNKTYEIWVAEGVYYPDRDGDGDHIPHAVTETFRLSYNNVHLYGGFSGTETAREQRDWETNVTVLSGDVDGNDLTDSHGIVTHTANINGSNAYHVLYVDGGSARIARANSVIDGFTVTAGQASSGSYPDYRGGALYVDSHLSGHTPPELTHIAFIGNLASQDGGALYNRSNPALTDITFDRNRASSYGGALYNTGNSTLTNVTFSGNSSRRGGGMGNTGSPTLINATFSGNSADWYGGAMYNTSTSSPSLINATFSENSAVWYGGAMYNTSTSSPALINATFSGNSAGFNGGAAYNTVASTLTLANAILWGNTAIGSAQIYNSASSTSTIGYSNIQDSGGSGAGWDAGLGADGGGNIDANPQLMDAAGGDVRLGNTSPCIDAGDNSALAPSVTTDLDGKPRRVDIPTIADTGNGTAPIVDMGAYEAQPIADLSLSKTASAAALNPGDAVTYVLTFANAGSGEAVSVAITDVVPVAVTVSHVISDCDVPITQTVSGAYTYTWSMDSLDFGQSGVITLTGVLSDPLEAGTTFTNTALITSATEEWNTTNNTAVAGLTVKNAAPEASDDLYLTAEDTALSVPAPGVLNNDSDGNGDALTAVKDSDPAQGTLDLSSDGSFVYTPTLDYHGAVTFTYHASDVLSDSNTALVTITVSARNDAPVATDNAYGTPEDTAVSGNVLSDDTGDGVDGDVDGDALTAVKDSDPAQGMLDLSSDGSFVYTPTADYHGIVTFAYHATDVLSDSNTALVTITVGALGGLSLISDSPTAIGQTTTLTASLVAGENVTYAFDLGDGSALLTDTMTAGVPISFAHIYPSAGTYTATFTASDGMRTQVAMATVVIQDPIVGLTAWNDSPTEFGKLTTLTATVTSGSDVVFSWSLGDENSHTGSTVPHTYPAVGIYTAIVTASNGVSQLVTATVVAITDAPIRDLIALNDSPTLLGYTTTLTASISSGSNVVCTWALGDGATQSGPRVIQHRYDSAGVYTAVVTASNSLGTFTSTTTVTITQPTVDLAPAYSVGEGEGTATITVTLSEAIGDPVTVEYATADGTATGGGDYEGQAGLLTFDPGETEQTFAIPVYDDGIYEADETVLLSLANPTHAGLGMAASKLTIVNDDGRPEVSLSDTAYPVDETAGLATITVTLSYPSDETIAVDYATADGTATAGTDYGTVSDTLILNPGALTQTFAVPIYDDGDVEGSETVQVSLTNAVHALLSYPSQATLTIVDDEPLASDYVVYLPFVSRRYTMATNLDLAAADVPSVSPVRR